ncbi:hypothetical protein RHGRI_009836 [Rhododendron griersonianum]|uniref:CBS domain-containing protein n=1 Tax=Rhododendron griersonianum TaxID=479676 RepID=A0AAV6KGC1_9ERIC|nr:hypothetical protein RHGRI_009836 [Rhododendron griersonianum]
MLKRRMRRYDQETMLDFPDSLFREDPLPDEKLMAEMPHKVLAVDVCSDKIKHLLEPAEASVLWADRIQFHRINIKNDSRLEGLIQMADLVTHAHTLSL